MANKKCHFWATDAISRYWYGNCYLKTLSDDRVWLIFNSGGTYESSDRKGSKKIYSLDRPNLCLRLSRHVGTTHEVKEGSARSLEIR